MSHDPPLFTSVTLWSDQGSPLATFQPHSDQTHLSSVLQPPADGLSEIISISESGKVRSTVKLDLRHSGISVNSLSLCIHHTCPKESHLSASSKIWLHICRFLSHWSSDLRIQLYSEHSTGDISVSESAASLGRSHSDGTVSLGRLRSFAVSTAAKHSVYFEKSELDTFLESLCECGSSIDGSSSAISAIDKVRISFSDLWRIVYSTHTRTAPMIDATASKLARLIHQEFYVPSPLKLSDLSKDLIPQLQSICSLTNVMNAVVFCPLSKYNSSERREIKYKSERLREFVTLFSQCLNRSLEERNQELILRCEDAATVTPGLDILRDNSFMKKDRRRSSEASSSLIDVSDYSFSAASSSLCTPVKESRHLQRSVSAGRSPLRMDHCDDLTTLEHNDVDQVRLNQVPSNKSRLLIAPHSCRLGSHSRICLVSGVVDSPDCPLRPSKSVPKEMDGQRSLIVTDGSDKCKQTMVLPPIVPVSDCSAHTRGDDLIRRDHADQVRHLCRQSRNLRQEKDRFKREMKVWQSKFEQISREIEERKKHSDMGNEERRKLSDQLVKLKHKHRELKKKNREDQRRLESVRDKLKNGMTLMNDKSQSMMEMGIIQHGLIPNQQSMSMDESLTAMIDCLTGMTEKYTEICLKVQNECKKKENEANAVADLSKIGDWAVRELGVVKWDDRATINERVTLLDSSLKSLKKRQKSRLISKMRTDQFICEEGRLDHMRDLLSKVNELLGVNLRRHGSEEDSSQASSHCAIAAIVSPPSRSPFLPNRERKRRGNGHIRAETSLDGCDAQEKTVDFSVCSVSHSARVCRSRSQSAGVLTFDAGWLESIRNGREPLCKEDLMLDWDGVLLALNEAVDSTVLMHRELEKRHSEQQRRFEEVFAEVFPDKIKDASWDELLECHRNLIDQSDRLKVELSDMRESEKEWRVRSDVHGSENVRLKGELGRMNDSNEELQREIAQSMIHLRRLKQENRVMMNEQSASKEVCDRMQRELDESKAELDGWKDVCQMMQTNLFDGSVSNSDGKSVSHLDGFREWITTVSQHLLNERSQTKLQLESVTRLMEECERVTSQLDNAHQSLDQLTAENQTLRNEISEMHRINDTVQSQSIGIQTDCIPSKHHDPSSLQAQIAQLKEENSELLCEIDSMIRRRYELREDHTNHTMDATLMVVNPRQMIAVTAGKDRTVRLWKPSEGRRNSSESSDRITAVMWAPFRSARVDGFVLGLCWSDSGQMLAAGGSLNDSPQGSLVVWDALTSQVVCTIRSRETQRFGRLHSVCFVCGDRVISAGDTTGCVRLWDLLTLQVLCVLQPSRDIIHALCAFDGRFLYSASHDGCVMRSPLKKLESRLSKLWSALGGRAKLQSMDALTLRRLVLQTDEHPALQCCKLRSHSVMTDDRYPLRTLTLVQGMPLMTMPLLLTGSRKLCALVGGSAACVTAVRSRDSDMIDGLAANGALLCVHRAGLSHVRVFDFGRTDADSVRYDDRGIYECAEPGISGVVAAGVSSDRSCCVVCGIGSDLRCSVTSTPIRKRRASTVGASAAAASVNVTSVDEDNTTTVGDSFLLDPAQF